MSSLAQRHLRYLTAAAALILFSTAGLLPVASAAFGCEGSMVETENEDETTKEGKKPAFSPKEQRDEIWNQTWTARGGPVQVTASIFTVLKGNIWAEGKKCALRVYAVGESCVTSFLIKCLAAGELLAAEQELKQAGKLPALGLYVATCLK